MTQKVRTGVAQNFKTGFVFSGDDRQLRVNLNQVGCINQFAVNTTSDTGFRQARADIKGNIKGRNGAIKNALASIRKSNDRHANSLISSGAPHDRAHLEKYLSLNSRSYSRYLALPCQI
ncbi:hypothetical protein SRABI106_03408 [Rahnella aquatilis]|nr:hypothetical protein SRABI106_03408 [Rahnella aquatilis]